MSLVESVLAGERYALARLLTRVENNTLEGRADLDRLFVHTGQAHLVGITGSPGTGKSSLVGQLALALRHPQWNVLEKGQNVPSEEGNLGEGTPRRVAEAKPPRVAIVAIDPSSPFSGGALLGDRVRMRDLTGDPGVFIRSMASRGALGGLAAATAAVVQVLDAAGFEMILIETVGAGQAEVDIARLAHTTLVVEAPGLGDDIQAIKAGILEIADILVVNKADLAGADNTERSLRMMLELAPSAGRPHAEVPGSFGRELPGWQVPVLRTIAAQGQGITEVIAAIERHAAYLKASGAWQERERQRLQHNLDDLLQAALVARWRSQAPEENYQAVLEQLCQRRLSPYQAVEKLTGNE